jgi:hypothetical protein
MYGVQVRTGEDWTSWRYIGWQWMSRVLPAKATLVDIALSLTSFSALQVRLTVIPSRWTASLHGQPTWSTRRSAGRHLVKLCIEVCCCFYRAFRIRLNQFLYKCNLKHQWPQSSAMS